MTVNNPNPPPATPPVDPPATPPVDPPATPPVDPPATPGPVPYERFAEVNKQFKALQAEVDAMKATQKTANETALKDQNKYKELYETQATELSAEKTRRERLEVATRKGLPPALADRLVGETVEAMEADADRLLEFAKPTGAPGVPPAGKGQPPKPVDMSTMTPAEIRELSTDKRRQALAQ